MACEDIPSVEDLQKTKLRITHYGELIDGTSTGTSTNPITGKTLTTYEQAIKNLGFKPGSGDFGTGFTVMPSQRDVAWKWPAPDGDNNYYSYEGEVPDTGLVIAAGSSPADYGGINETHWQPRTDEVSRGLAREALRRTYAAIGLDLADGSFQASGTLTNVGQVLLDERDDKAYGWAGIYPKDVDKGSTPETSGGIGLGAWVDKSNALTTRDIAHPKDHGAIADGTYHPLSERYTTLAAAQAVYPHATALTQSIDWAAFQAAFNAGAGTIDYRTGKYFINSTLTRSIDTNLVGDKASRITLVGGAQILIAGSITQIADLASNVTKVSRSLTFASAPNIVAGDTVLLFNPTDYSWSQHRAYYREGEFFKIHSVSGNVANIYGLPSDPYTAANMDVYRVDGVAVTLDDVYVEGDSSISSAPIIIRFGVDVTVNGFRGRLSQAYQLEIDRCFCVDISGGAAVNNSPYVDDEYGIIISNSSNVTFNGGNHFSTRHAIALGGGAGTGAIPCRNVKIIGANLLNFGNDIGASDMHGNCDNVQYVDCNVDASANMAGRNSKYINCRILQRTSPSDGLCIFGSEIVGGQFDIIDCELVTQGDLASFGAITLSMVKTLKQDLTVKVRNLTVRGGAGGSLAKLVKISAAVGETNKINADIRGVRCDLDQALCVLFVRCEANTAQTVVSNGHIVDDIYGPVGMALIHDTGAALTNIPTRQMRQAGYVDITTTVSTLAAAAAGSLSFRYPYSKLPTVQVGVSSPSGAAMGSVGAQPASPIMYSLTATQPRPAIVTPANMTAGVAVRLHWSAGIDEI